MRTCCSLYFWTGRTCGKMYARICSSFYQKCFSSTGKLAREELHILAMVWWCDGTHKKASQTTLEWRVRKLQKFWVSFSVIRWKMWQKRKIKVLPFSVWRLDCMLRQSVFVFLFCLILSCQLRQWFTFRVFRGQLGRLVLTNNIELQWSREVMRHSRGQFHVVYLFSFLEPSWAL